MSIKNREAKTQRFCIEEGNEPIQ